MHLQRAVIIIIQKTTCTRSDRQNTETTEKKMKERQRANTPIQTKLSLISSHYRSCINNNLTVPSTLDSACVAYSLVELYNIKSLTATSSSPVFILASSCNTDSEVSSSHMGTSPVGEPRPNPGWGRVG